MHRQLPLPDLSLSNTQESVVDTDMAETEEVGKAEGWAEEGLEGTVV